MFHVENEKIPIIASNSNDALPELDVHLIAQELANTGSMQSEKQLSYIMDAFIAAECYEWIFLLAIVLRRTAIVKEIMRQLISSELPNNVANSLQQGISELNVWSQNEWFVFNNFIIKYI